MFITLQSLYERWSGPTWPWRPYSWHLAHRAPHFTYFTLFYSIILVYPRAVFPQSQNGIWICPELWEIMGVWYDCDMWELCDMWYVNLNEFDTIESLLQTNQTIAQW
jgi:hypothetical protein